MGSLQGLLETFTLLPLLCVEAFLCMFVTAAFLNNALNYLKHWLLILILFTFQANNAIKLGIGEHFSCFSSHCLTSFLEKFCHSADSFICSVGGLNSLLYTFTTHTCIHPPLPPPHPIHYCIGITFFDIHVCVVIQLYLWQRQMN